MDFDELRSKAENLVREHADQVEDGIEKAGELAKGKFGHESQVDAAVDKLKDVIPGGE